MADRILPRPRIVSIVDCPRCHGHHPDLEFKRMTTATGMRWWSTCPTSGESMFPLYPEQWAAVAKVPAVEVDELG